MPEDTTAPKDRHTWLSLLWVLLGVLGFLVIYFLFIFLIVQGTGPWHEAGDRFRHEEGDTTEWAPAECTPHTPRLIGVQLLNTTADGDLIPERMEHRGQ